MKAIEKDHLAGKHAIKDISNAMLAATIFDGCNFCLRRADKVNNKARARFMKSKAVKSNEYK